MRMLKVASSQMACSWDKAQNIALATELVTQAAMDILNYN
jgi:predicted amidohydrolase